MAISQKVATETKKFVNEYLSNISIDDLPINIDILVKKLRIDLVNYTFDDDISGVLVLNESQPTIGVNQGHSEVRRRFTIAHELGHFILHKDQGTMFMDKILFRKNSEKYSSKDEKLEKEANYFAANVLMPENAVRDLFSESIIDFYDDEDIRTLASKFKVSSSAMTYRLINLGLIDYK